MMKPKRQEFVTKKQFMDWIRQVMRSVRCNQEPSLVFVGYDPVSWRLSASCAQEADRPGWAYRAFEIPRTVAEAKEIWDGTHEDFLCLFFQLDLYVGSIIVAARNGAWRSIDDTYLAYRKAEFREITDEEAKRAVKDKTTWSALCGEVQMFGISCRLL